MTETSYGTGRRKTATARVFLREGTGEMTVNGVGMDDYFGSEVLKMIIRQPLQVVEKEGELDMWASVRGGGSSGQAGAIRHGLSRALVEFEPTFRESLKTAGFMTRDPRRKERKKYGQKGARARFQFSKR
ncbi:MAG: 30S ribosomal protein S9 [Holophagales bacterium]|nr:30S ribosomal protein S9 [Holophagales bacterium]MXX59977.1 30S ribosomal protein S9 [Holophagales bacterium]MYA06486.1 30S ribosomal protein S9 [Holophagales bacterium]MYC10107.1 30S ribosomal protein S9 [Holophagales bacterium]MYD21359.1 30S ribosomal protein S9 [Holophagales bacterium]